MEPERLLDGLDERQREAVTSTAMPLAILAGAGSGKTRVLTRRIAYRSLIGDADPRHVLAVTFTRKAAGELDSRLRSFGLRDLPAAGTFHGLAYAQLRTAWAAEGTAAPTLLDRKGRVLARILGGTRRVTPADLAAEIEWAKARLISPDRYADAVHRAGRTTVVDPERIADWYRRYETEKSRRGLVDFDDLLEQSARRIESDPTVAAAQRWRFRHLFVDEFQDVNPLQERLLRAWLGDGVDLCVVGDPNQAIYGWNGADPSFLTDFAVHHPGAEVIELRDSYRSTPQILGVAAALLEAANGTSRPLRAHRQDGPLPEVIGYQSDADEANGTARAVRDRHGPGKPWSAQAVLVRTNAQAALFETAFRRAGIPYRVRGANRLLDEPEARDLLARITRLDEPLTTTLADLDAGIVSQRSDLNLSADADPLPGDTAADRRLHVHEQISRLGHEFLALDPGARAADLPGWLRTVLLDDRADSADAVTIASFHSAKGLEWPIVHIAGVETGYLPISQARTASARAEEERLFYVAVTRATEVLRCTWAQRRTFGTDEVERKPSPYLAVVRSAIGRMDDGAVVSADPVDQIAQARLVAPIDLTDTAAADRVRVALRTWREEVARQARVGPTVVLSDRALESLAVRRPITDADLADVAGLGPLQRREQGARLLAIVAAALAMDASPAST